MVLTGSSDTRAAPADDSHEARELIWHDLECGGYDADLPLWRSLAAERRPGDRVLEIGAGSGRVALDLAAAGHGVSALELDGRLLDALGARAEQLGVEVERLCADARTFDLGARRFGLCVVPMQTLQLLGGETGRVAFLRRARAHLRPGGVLACAIVTEIERFDCTRGEDGPPAETAVMDGTLYVSRAIRVCEREDGFLIERGRWVLSPAPAAHDTDALEDTGALALGAAEHDEVALDLVSVERLQREAAGAGFRPLPSRTIEATDEYVASEVVMLGA